MDRSAQLLAAIGRRARKRRLLPPAPVHQAPTINLVVNVGAPAPRARRSVVPGKLGEYLTAGSDYVHPHRKRQIAPYPG